MPKVLISAPIYKREWIIPYWLECIERQNFPLSDIGFIFELGPDDDDTHNALLDWHANHPEVICFQGDIQARVHHQAHPEGLRYWDQIRYLTMVELRNNLMIRAEAMQDTFDYLFSLDSDILLQDPETLNKLIAYSEEYPRTVISPLSYMTPDSTEFPSVMSWREHVGHGAYRRNDYPIGTAFLADIVMAAVLMPKEIYRTVRYRLHRQGEDLGFACELYRHKFRSLAATDIYCPHIMHRSMLESHVNNWLSLA